MRGGALIIAFGLIAGGACADTVYLTGGAALDGVVSRPNENTIVLETEGGSLSFQTSEVERVETNAKRGAFVNPMVQRHEDEQFKRTGLTAEQRDEIQALMDPLKSENEGEVARARKAVLKKGKELDLFKYFESSLTNLTGLYAPLVLELIEELYPDRALPILRTYAEHIEPVTRAKALELLGARKSKPDLELIARGVVDPEPEVILAAMKALHELGDRRAIPLYLAGLGSPDPRIRATALAILTIAWKGTPNMPVDGAPAAWQALWATESAKVSDPLDPKKLRPLAVNESGEPLTYHNE